MSELLRQPPDVHASSKFIGFNPTCNSNHHWISRNKIKFVSLPRIFSVTYRGGDFGSLMDDKKGYLSSRKYLSLKVSREKKNCKDGFARRRHAVSSTLGKESCSEFDNDPSWDAEGAVAEEDDPLKNIKQGFFEFIRSLGGQLQPGAYQTELLLLALPAIIGQAIDPMAQLAETAYIGRLGSIELASAGVSVTIFNIISKLFNVPLLSITTSFVAEDLSKHSSQDHISDPGSYERTFQEKTVPDKTPKRQQLPSVSTALLLAVGIGVFEGLTLFFGAGHFLKLMGIATDSPMYGPAQKFLSLRALGAPAVVLSLAIQGIFRGFKDTQTPLFCVGFGSLSAVCLLPILVYTFQFGLIGAAVATISSQYITILMLAWSLSRKVLLLPPKLKDLEFDGYIKSGGMLLGRTLSVLITMTLGTSMAARQGSLAMAAHQICLQVWLAVSLLSDALALSAQALIASSFAKCDYKRVKDITIFVLKSGIFIGIALAMLLGVSFGSLAELFTKDTVVLEIVKTGILFVSASQPINALAFIFDGLHYGVSDFSYAATSMMVIGAMSSAFLLYAPPRFGLPGVWSGLTLFMTLRMAAGFVRLRWKNGPWQFLWHDHPLSEQFNRFCLFIYGLTVANGRSLTDEASLGASLYQQLWENSLHA